LNRFGYIRAAACVPEMTVANIPENARRIVRMISEADERGADIAVFPELALTGYTCADLFRQKALLDGSLKAAAMIMEQTADMALTSVIGLPVIHEDKMYDAAFVISRGELTGIAVKTYIPNYNEFYEKRWFSSADGITVPEFDFMGKKVPIGNDLVFRNTACDGLVFSAEICEDLWAPIPPSTFQAMGGAMIVLNLSASNELVGKADYRRELVRSHSGRTMTGYVYVSAGPGESSTDTVYGGHAMISEYGQMLSESRRFETGPVMTIGEIDVQRLKHNRIGNNPFMEYAEKKKIRLISYHAEIRDNKTIMRAYERHPFVPGNKETLDSRCGEIFNIQTLALYKRMKHIGAKKAVIGISGGLDSTLALLVTEKAMEKLGMPAEDIIALTMPGFGTSDSTYRNAVALIKKIGAQKRKISILDACKSHFKDISHDRDTYDVVFENVQARERTMILMNTANKEGGIVVGTGDLSEIALGWSTYNGDHMSMYAVNCGVPKTLVRFLIGWVAENESDNELKNLLKRIIATPISPELLPADTDGSISQKTEDLIGPYELHDFFLYHMVRNGSDPAKILFLAGSAFKDSYGKDEIKKWLRLFYTRFFQNQYKRSCIPDGPKVGTIALSPRADWRMPSDADAAIWLDALEKL
jgi:NAD+ synthase (glutamine-hydrolysing)